MPWENDNIAEFMAAGRRFTVEKLTYNANFIQEKTKKGNTLTDQSDKAYLDSKITSLQMNATAIGNLAANQVYFVVTDSVSEAMEALALILLLTLMSYFLMINPCV